MMVQDSFYTPAKEDDTEGDLSQMNLSYSYTPDSDIEEEEEEEAEEETEILGKKYQKIEKEMVVEETEVVPSVETESEIKTDSLPPAPLSSIQETVHSESIKDAAPSASAPSTSAPSASAPVEGFQLVQATGLTDTSTPAPIGSDIPSFATATPLQVGELPEHVSNGDGYRQPIPKPGPSREDSNPLMDDSKSKQFTARTDFMIAEFFSRQVSRLTKGAPAALDRSYRIFQQRFKERLGAQWAHITSQPEVEEAIKRVQEMYDYFEQLEKIVARQRGAISKSNQAEAELALCVAESAGPIRDDMLYLSESYFKVCRERDVLLSAYEQYLEFLSTFKVKAVGDALTTMKKQHASRLELDAYGSKLGQLEERKLKTFAKAPSYSEAASLEKELTNTRGKFQDAKNKYQNLSTSLIDKAGLLDLKKGVDFAAHIHKIRIVYDSFNRGRVGGPNEKAVIDEEMVVDDYMLAHGVPKVETE